MKFVATIDLKRPDNWIIWKQVIDDNYSPYKAPSNRPYSSTSIYTFDQIYNLWDGNNNLEIKIIKASSYDDLLEKMLEYLI